METVIVTGGAGFIGSHTVDLLMSRGYRPVVIDDFSKGLRENVASGVTVVNASITNREHMAQALESIGDTAAIIHCAAQSSVIESTQNPLRDLETNIGGTVNVLEMARAAGCPVVFTSTGGAMYGAGSPRPTPESEYPTPLSPYGCSKAAAEFYVRYRAAEDCLPHAICRLGNVYGPRQRGDGEAGVVAIITNRLRLDEQVTLYGYGRATRDYVHVADVARALVESIGVPGTFNIATGVATTVDEIFDLIRAQLPEAIHNEPVRMPLRPGELEASCLDVTRASETLSWSARIDVATGIPSTVRSLLSA